MDNVAVAEELKSLILDNAALLVEGLIFQGDVVEAAQVTESVLSPVIDTLFLAVHIPIAYERSQRQSNLRKPTREAVYQTQIEVTDLGIEQVDDDQPYEVVHRNFRRFCNRIVKLLNDQTWITDSPRTELLRDAANDRRIDFIDLSSSDQSVVAARLYGQIGFTLVEKCVDDTTLYP